MDKSSLYVADINAFKRLAEIIQNVTHTNIFPVVLADSKYLQANINTYSKGNEHIEVYSIRGEWRYQNLNHQWDTGNIVQFIANRWDGTLRDCNNIPTIHAAAFIAKGYYQRLKKQLRHEHKSARKILNVHKNGINRKY